jgi:hypothetical protein
MLAAAGCSHDIRGMLPPSVVNTVRQYRDMPPIRGPNPSNSNCLDPQHPTNEASALFKKWPAVK